MDVAGEIAMSRISSCSVTNRKIWDLYYPKIVRQMLMSRSAPQPAMQATPAGGTDSC